MAFELTSGHHSFITLIMKIIKIMKSILKLFLILWAGFTFWGCAEDEEVPNEPAPNTPSTVVNFAVEHQTLAEAGNPLKVNLAFDRVAAVNGSFSIRLSGDAVYQQDFTTAPAASEGVITLNVEKGQANTHFTLTPVNNEDSLGNRTTSFTLENPSNGFKLGNKTVASVEIIEDDSVSAPGNGGEEATIEFGENLVHISESDIQGFDISMLLQGSVAHTEIVTIDILPMEGFEYGTDYVTDPISVQNTFELEITPWTQDLKFRVIPINDQELYGSFELKFSILTTSDGIKTGTQTAVTVKIEEDDVIDPATLYTIADLRSKFENYGGDWYLPNDYYIEGIITSDKNVVDDKAVYIQDATGGIMLIFNGPKLLHQGDKVQLNLKNAEGKNVNGQKAMMGVEDRVGITLGHNFEVEPEIITLEQLHSGNYQGKRVRVQNVSFPSADGFKIWLGAHRFSDGNREGIVTTFATADFTQEVLPAGKVTITGIVGDWNRIHPQQYLRDVVK